VSEGTKGDKDMEAKKWRSIIFLAVVVALCGWAAADVSDYTTVYASLPAQIEISVPSQYKDLQMEGCSPDESISVAGGVDVKSNTNWGLTIAGSTPSGHMVGSASSPVHELHNPMTIQAQSSPDGPVAVPGTDFSPPTAALLSNVGPGDFSDTSAIGLTFEQTFRWDDYADENYQITVTLTATPA
jgi:hypothetical protein